MVCDQGECERGRVGEWESGRVGEGESGRVGEWESGRVGEWERDSSAPQPDAPEFGAQEKIGPLRSE